MMELAIGLSLLVTVGIGFALMLSHARFQDSLPKLFATMKDRIANIIQSPRPRQGSERTTASDVDDAVLRQGEQPVLGNHVNSVFDGTIAPSDLGDPRSYDRRRVRPLESPATWFTEEDYPIEARRAGWQGTAGIRLHINRDGQPVTCQVVRSSGYAVLDDETCRLLLLRGRFAPAEDTIGRPVAADHSLRITWHLER